MFRHVVPNNDFRNRYLGPAFNIGGQMSAPFGRLPISAVADLSVLLNQNDLSPGEYSYVHTTGVQASFGLQYSR